MLFNCASIYRVTDEKKEILDMPISFFLTIIISTSLTVRGQPSPRFHAEVVLPFRNCEIDWVEYHLFWNHTRDCKIERAAQNAGITSNFKIGMINCNWTEWSAICQKSYAWFYNWTSAPFTVWNGLAVWVSTFSALWTVRLKTPTSAINSVIAAVGGQSDCGNHQWFQKGYN